MYSFTNLEPVYCSMSSSNCCFLTCIQIHEIGKVVWYSHLFKNFPQFVVIHIVKGFGVVNEGEVDCFLEFFAFSMIPQILKIWSIFSKSSLNIWNFSVHVLLKPSLENFEHYFANVWDECNCEVIWAFFGIAFGIGMKTDLLQYCGHFRVFQICWLYILSFGWFATYSKQSLNFIYYYNE